MNDDDTPQPGTAKLPPTVGDGCVRRYDPEALSEQHGTEFEGAEALWHRMQGEPQDSDTADK